MEDTSNLLMIGVPQEKVTQVIQLLAAAGVRITIFPRAPLPTFSPIFSGVPQSYLGVAKSSAELPPPPAPKKKITEKQKKKTVTLKEFCLENPEQSRMIKMGGRDLGIEQQPSLHAAVKNAIKRETGDENSLYGVFLHRNRDYGWWGFVAFKSAEAADDFEHYCQKLTFFHNHVRLDMRIEPYHIQEEEEEEEEGGMIEE